LYLGTTGYAARRDFLSPIAIMSRQNAANRRDGHKAWGMNRKEKAKAVSHSGFQQFGGRTKTMADENGYGSAQPHYPIHAPLEVRIRDHAADPTVANEPLDERLRLERLLTSLSSQFINLPADRIDSDIEDAQRRICELLDLDRSTLWQVCEEEPGTLLLTHIHQPQGSLPPPEQMNAADFFPWIVRQVLDGKAVAFSKITDLPPEASRDKESLSAYDTKSNVLIPLTVGAGPVFGVLTFAVMREERHWSKRVVMGFKLIAQVFANALARKQTDQALRESEARYRGIFDGALEGIFRISLHGKILVANPALVKMLGYDSVDDAFFDTEDAATRVWVDPDEHTRFIRFLEEQETIRAYECRFVRKDGTPLWVSLNSRAVRNADGQVVYHEGFIEDITLRRQAEDLLRSAYAEIKELKDRLASENFYLREQIRKDDEHCAIRGQSPAIQKVLRQIDQVAPTDAHVLITGETGTGKELVAQAIHMASKRKDRLMVTVNCAALPSSLIEGELFGREKGAYTGALTRQIGRFELADKGTIFLDEIGELSPELQVKLLRVIQEGEFERLGSSKTIRVDVRVITATNRNLADEVHTGIFRSDLYYRLKVFPIEVPPLRARAEDIPTLVWAFVEEFGIKMGKEINAISEKTMELLKGYAWPGNVRELRNTIERAMILSRSNRLEVLMADEWESTEAPLPTLEEAEHQLILDALTKTMWRIKGPHGAAQMLGLKPPTLYARMKKLGIPFRRSKDEALS
jgi:PAS domain S-box-containing protein